MKPQTQRIGSFLNKKSDQIYIVENILDELYTTTIRCVSRISITSFQQARHTFKEDFLFSAFLTIIRAILYLLKIEILCILLHNQAKRF
jgi:hypothetical protein